MVNHSNSSHSNSSQQQQDHDRLPSQIERHLFLGAHNHTQRDVMAKLRISYVLSLEASPVLLAGHQQQPPAACEPLEPNCSRDQTLRVDANTKIRWKRINVADNLRQVLARFFDEACEFIGEAVARQQNVLVHCMAGISRSPTVVIAYLMSKRLMSLNEAYALVKRKRPQISPNLNFMGQLVGYERQLGAAKTAQAAQHHLQHQHHVHQHQLRQDSAAQISRLAVANPAREGCRVLDVADAQHGLQQSLDAQSKASVRKRAKASRIQVPG